MAKSELQRQLEESVRLAKRGELPQQQKDALERRLRQLDDPDIDLPDALAGDEAFGNTPTHMVCGVCGGVHGTTDPCEDD